MVSSYRSSWSLLVGFLQACGAARGGTDAASAADAALEASLDADIGQNPDATADAATAWSPVCPAALPALGSSCANAGLYCEYGESFGPVCNAVRVCTSGTWGDAVIYGMLATCEAGANPPSCPADRGSITTGAPCSVVEACAYPQETCECVLPPDLTSGSINTTWYCGPAAGCPVPRPRMGSPCAVAGQQCDYQSCGNSQLCSGGVWQSAHNACGA